MFSQILSLLLYFPILIIAQANNNFNNYFDEISIIFVHIHLALRECFSSSKEISFQFPTEVGGKNPKKSAPPTLYIFI